MKEIKLDLEKLKGQNLHVDIAVGMFERPFDMVAARINVERAFELGGTEAALILILDQTLWRGFFRKVSSGQVSQYESDPLFVSAGQINHSAWRKVPREIGIDGNNFERIVLTTGNLVTDRQIDARLVNWK